MVTNMGSQKSMVDNYVLYEVCWHLSICSTFVSSNGELT
jgi:hypothetical protein